MIQDDELESHIDRLADQALVFEEEVDHWTAWQPALAAYVLSDDFSLLSELERETLLFGATVLLSLARKQQTRQEVITEDVIGELDESNWTAIEEASGRKLSDKMDVWFEGYPETELLAFIEDLCIDDEEEDLTPAGSEMMVVALKTVADALFLQKASIKATKV